jgi:hypothetical protein
MIFIVMAFICSVAAAKAGTHFYSLTPSAPPTNNPLKGFMPYQGSYATFPYSMEFNYLPLRSLMTGPTNFDWTSLDALISDIASRGHQTVFRIYLDYPTQPTGIPQFLLNEGLVTYAYTDYDNTLSVCPDYSNPLLDQSLTNFIAALGARYDGDQRIGFIQLGLLGFWGEWHTYPHNSWFASTAVQDEVLIAYAAAFHNTKLLTRYPSSTTAPFNMGFHDDSFAWDTLPPLSGSFLGGMQSVPGLTNRWQMQPIGGEVRPEVQLCMWDPSQTTCVPTGQAFSNCVSLTHASWMLNQGVFSPGFTGAQQNLALAGSQSMGYTLCVSNAVLADAWVSTPLNVSVSLQNTGVAPFYYDWPVQLGALNGNNTLVKTWAMTWKLSSLIPAVTNTLWSCVITNHGLGVGQYKIVSGVKNPLANGVPLRFANTAQDANLSGWLTLGQVSITPVPAGPSLTGNLFMSSFSLQISNAVPGAWIVQCSSNCVDWTPMLSTNTSSPEWNVTDEISPIKQFYRVVGLP